MAPNTSSVYGGPIPRTVHLLAPRTSPIITDGTVSIVLTDSYRLHPYLTHIDNKEIPRSIALPYAANVTHRYVMGVGLDPDLMWSPKPLQNRLRTMQPGWVFFFDCNPGMLLTRPVKKQNEYLATRDGLGLPPLRWAADLRSLAEREEMLREKGKRSSM
ncbi:hypothetical protein G6514_009805 [Epicoccum nigrum]|nr:hypothetical protein G6514_009805 [Epicoccum nigrum]